MFEIQYNLPLVFHVYELLTSDKRTHLRCYWSMMQNRWRLWSNTQTMHDPLKQWPSSLVFIDSVRSTTSIELQYSAKKV